MKTKSNHWPEATLVEVTSGPGRVSATFAFVDPVPLPDIVAAYKADEAALSNADKVAAIKALCEQSRAAKAAGTTPTTLLFPPGFTDEQKQAAANLVANYGVDTALGLGDLLEQQKVEIANVAVTFDYSCFDGAKGSMCGPDSLSPEDLKLAAEFAYGAALGAGKTRTFLASRLPAEAMAAIDAWEAATREAILGPNANTTSVGNSALAAVHLEVKAELDAALQLSRTEMLTAFANKAAAFLDSTDLNQYAVEGPMLTGGLGAEDGWDWPDALEDLCDIIAAYSNAFFFEDYDDAAVLNLLVQGDLDGVAASITASPDGARFRTRLAFFDRCDGQYERTLWMAIGNAGGLWPAAGRVVRNVAEYTDEIAAKGGAR